MSVFIASDHAGFSLKQTIIEALQLKNINISDLGPQNDDSCDYPDFAFKLAQAVVDGGAGLKGIMICGSGVGASIACNKIPGARASVCHDEYSAHQGVEHDDMNILVLGAKIVEEAHALKLVDLYLAASFEPAERFIRRLNKVIAKERSLMGANA